MRFLNDNTILAQDMRLWLLNNHVTDLNLVGDQCNKLDGGFLGLFFEYMLAANEVFKKEASFDNVLK